METVKFPTKLSRAFYRRAKKVFPNEEFAVLLGTYRNGKAVIRALYYPPQRLETLNPDMVPITIDWYLDAEKAAKILGFQILGDIHTHCYDLEPDESPADAPDVIPSGSDWESAHVLRSWAPRKYRIMGIVRVTRKKDRLSCRTKFFPAVNLPKTVK